MTTPNPDDELALARLALARRLRGLATRAHYMDASAILCFHRHLDDAREERRITEGRGPDEPPARTQ